MSGFDSQDVSQMVLVTGNPVDRTQVLPRIEVFDEDETPLHLAATSVPETTDKMYVGTHLVDRVYLGSDLMWPSLSGTPVTVIQTAIPNENNQPDTIVTLSDPTTNGNTLLVGISLFGQDGGSIEIDMASSNPVVDGTNVFTAIPSAEVKRSAGTWYQHSYFYIAEDITGEATSVITTNFDRATYSFVTVWELSPCQFDHAVTNTDIGLDIDIGTLTPSVSGALAVMLVEYEGGDNAALISDSDWIFERNAQAGGGSTAHGHYNQTTPAAINFHMVNVPSDGGPTGGLFWSGSGLILKGRV